MTFIYDFFLWKKSILLCFVLIFVPSFSFWRVMVFFQRRCDSTIMSTGGSVKQPINGSRPDDAAYRIIYKTQDFISPKKERKKSDLRSEDEVGIFLCRSCRCRHPPRICSCSSWWRKRERPSSSVRYQGNDQNTAPDLTPLCQCEADALAFLWCVSYGNGWS